MFCRNCGKEVAGAPEFCTNCGARPMSSTNFCSACGAPTTPRTEVCPKCGAKLTNKTRPTTGGWIPVTAGAFDLVVGAIGLAGGILAAVIGGLATWFIGGGGAAYGAAVAVLSIVAITGGICAITKRRWNLALAGSICGLIAGILLMGFPLVVALAIAAIAFTAIGKQQFA